MMRLGHKVAVGFAALVLLLLSRHVSGAPPQQYEPFVASPEYRKALESIGNGLNDEASRALTQIAVSNRGRTLGARALLRRVELEAASNQIQTAKATCQEIIAGYPSSSFEIAARIWLIDLDYHRDLDNPAKLERYNQLAQTSGGPSVNQVVATPTRALKEVLALSSELKVGLAGVYSRAAAMLEVQGRHQEAFQLAHFCQEAFPTSPVYAHFAYQALSNQIQHRLGEQGFLEWSSNPTPPVNPDIRIRSPKPGQVKGPRPKIRFEIFGGDWRSPRVDLGALKFTIDGQDMTRSMRLRVVSNDKLKDGATYEKLRVVARPATPLSRGTHSVEVIAYVQDYEGQGPGVGRVAWAFYVGKDQDDDDDECDDDKNQWGD